MVTVEINLPKRSLFLFSTWLVMLPSTALAFIVAKQSSIPSLCIPLYMLGAFGAASCLSQICLGFWANNLWAFAPFLLFLLGQFVCFSYWIAARLFGHSAASSGRLEAVLAIVWTFGFVVSTNLFVMVLYLLWTDKPAVLGSPVTLKESWSEDAEKAEVQMAAEPPMGGPRAHRSSGSLVSFKRKHRNNQSAPLPTIPNLSGLEAVPEGFMDMSWDINSNVQYLIQNASGSRNVSGSTQNSGFAATDYNKRISSTGFVKDEPTVKKLHKSKTLSHYDLEQNQNRLHEII